MTPGERIDALELRVRKLEDTVEIYRLLASYGPAVDSDSRETAAQQWVEEGVYDVDVGVWSGRTEILGMLSGDMHQAMMERGCAHQVSLPHLVVDGERAVATNYMSLIASDGAQHVIVRQSANRWELTKTDDGWRVERRTNRLLDGRQDARELLGRGLDGPPR